MAPYVDLEKNELLMIIIETSQNMPLICPFLTNMVKKCKWLNHEECKKALKNENIRN